jgi:hypothetical protein
VTVLAILAAACLAWGLCAALVVALADRDGTLHHLLDLLHRLGGNRA